MGMGVRRLSIIDLALGRQPISNEDGTVWVALNGEICNYRELRSSLACRGHRFRTRSDTEVLVHLYEEHGVDGIQRLRGMFACAIWDSRRQSLLLVRDRFGQKPLYYAALPQGLYFGSELKCLRAAGVPLRHNREALQLYLLLGYIPDPWTPYAGIRKLGPGGWLSCDSGGRIEEGRYWTLPAPAEQRPTALSEQEACDSVRHVFDQAVKMHLTSDVPVGAFLSGGIDSASVVASMALQSPQPVKTFSIGFDESGCNQLSLAAALARKYSTEHHHLVVRPDSVDAVDLVSKLARHFDEPFGDSSAIPAYLVSEFAARYVKVALSGDGGDGLLAGYESFPDRHGLRLLNHVPAAVRTLLSRIGDLLPYSAFGKDYLRMISRPTVLERYFEGAAPHYLFERLLTPEWMPSTDTAFLRRKMAHGLFPGLVLPGMLVKVDRMSMANSLEIRSPMLDHELAELAVRIPLSWKLKKGRRNDIFIRAVGHRLPQELLRHPGRAFGVPLGRWFRGSLRSFVWDHLTSRPFLDRRMVSAQFVMHLLEEHDSGRRDNHRHLWKLLMLELWFQEDGSLQSAATSAEACTVRTCPV